jgi:hypothetical protein
VSERESSVETTAETLLREELQAELGTLAPRFDGFAEAVLARLDAGEAAEPERVLRADEASAEEQADLPLFEEDFELAGAALREEIAAELAAQDWSAFAAGIEDGIDGEALAPAVGALLREEVAAELAAQDWSGFAAGVEDGIDGEALAPAVGALLREEVAAELAAQDWSGFAAGVEDGIDGEALAPAIGAALREATAEAVAARDGEWASFTSGVMAGLPAETVTVAELLTEEVEAELAQREGEWSAFTARVFEAVDAESRAVARAPLEAQAVEQLKHEVESEVEAMSGAFGETFRKEVEREIFKSAQEPTPWWTSAWAWVKAQLSGGEGYGLVAAAATAALLIAVTGVPRGDDPALPAIAVAPPGSVAVEALSFEGDVTVMPEDGITIVWIDAPS